MGLPEFRVTVVGPCFPSAAAGKRDLLETLLILLAWVSWAGQASGVVGARPTPSGPHPQPPSLLGISEGAAWRES